MKKIKMRIKAGRCLTAGILACTAALTGCAGYYGKYDEPLVSREESRITISVLAGQSTSDAGIEDMIDEMAAEKFPGVELDWECVDWGNDFDAQLQGKIASGDIPDIIIGKAQDVRPYVENKTLAPLTLHGTEQIEATALNSVMVDGVIYGLPYNAWYQGVLYNKEIFRELGLNVPETRKELARTVKELSRAGKVPFASHFQEAWNVGNTTMQFMIGDVFSGRPDWGECFRLGEVSFTNDPAMQKCFEQNRYIMEYSWKDALIIDQYESDKRFAEGQAAMYLTGSWSLQAVNQYDVEGSYGIFPYPNEKGDASLIKETNMTFMMGAASSQKELVTQIFEELLQNEKLMQEILDFTQTYSVSDQVETGYHSSIEEDVRQYEESGRVIDATVGNGQLVWSYQNQVAAETLKWLKQEQDLQSVFGYADMYRNDS